jgi:hypothetical protein
MKVLQDVGRICIGLAVIDPVDCGTRGRGTCDWFLPVPPDVKARVLEPDE